MKCSARSASGIEDRSRSEQNTFLSQPAGSGVRGASHPDPVPAMNASDIPYVIVGLAIYSSPVVAYYAIKVPFLLTLRSALLVCHPDNRRMDPNAVWLGLIPVF